LAKYYYTNVSCLFLLLIIITTTPNVPIEYHHHYDRRLFLKKKSLGSDDDSSFPIGPISPASGSRFHPLRTLSKAPRKLMSCARTKEINKNMHNNFELGWFIHVLIEMAPVSLLKQECPYSKEYI